VITTVSGHFEIQILHNSDLHAKFEQTNAKSGPCSEEQARLGQCYGGIARLKTAIKQAFKDVENDGIPTIVLNAGDFFVGTPYYVMKKWELVVPMVDALKFDAAVSST
jgi:5'-nucleotidase